jgi:hypothetical protein
VKHPLSLPTIPRAKKDGTMPTPFVSVWQDTAAANKRSLVLQIKPAHHIDQLLVKKYYVFNYIELSAETDSLSDRKWKQLACVDTVPGVMLITLKDVRPNIRYHFLVASADDKRHSFFSRCATFLTKQADPIAS